MFLLSSFFKKKIYSFLEKEERGQKERERNIDPVHALTRH